MMKPIHKIKGRYLQIRVTDEEHTRIKELAQAHRMTITDYIFAYGFKRRENDND